MINNEVFTEQAEYLPPESFEEWSTSLQDEATIIKKLSQGGAKLITGPRGCGKTTLFLKVYNKLIKDQTAGVLPIYVNFKSSLKLEPLYRNNTNAAYWFNQWLLHKVHHGLYTSMAHIQPEDLNLKEQCKIFEKNINYLEMGRVDFDNQEEVTLHELLEEISNNLIQCGKSRCVLLLDDAGHAFSSEQQHDFFEFFREIKTKTVSPKAAVYPGVTSYSSSFHIGHDAEEIDVWLKPSSTGYMDFMHSLLKTRLGHDVYDQLMENEKLVDLMCYASYGIPRALLNMIAEFNKEVTGGENATLIKLTNKNVLAAIKNNFDRTYQIYDTLQIKLPMYSNFVQIGAEIYEKFLRIVKSFNRENSTYKQSSILAIRRPISSELNKVIGFFQYAGLISTQGLSSRGGKGVYELYELHYSSIVERNVFFSSRGINIDNYIEAFSHRPNHHYPRYSENVILSSVTNTVGFSLALPPCPSCNTPRISEESKFCSRCGVKLKDASIFDSIVSQDISKLPITPHRANTIKRHSKIRKIKDILLDSDNRELFTVPRIGPVWARKIKTYAEEFIA